MAKKTCDPLYQQALLFDEGPQGKVLQVSVYRVAFKFRSSTKPFTSPLFLLLWGYTWAGDTHVEWSQFSFTLKWLPGIE